MTTWTQQQTETMNRNRAIVGRNRNLRTIWQMLGCPERFYELPLEPMPLTQKEQGSESEDRRPETP